MTPGEKIFGEPCFCKQMKDDGLEDMLPCTPCQIDAVIKEATAALTVERDKALTRIVHMEADAEQYAFVSERDREALTKERDTLRNALERVRGLLGVSQGSKCLCDQAEAVANCALEPK